MKPILFNTEMVRAILDGRKTVTRRLVKPQPTMADLSFLGKRSDIDEAKLESYKAKIVQNIKEATLRDRKPPYQLGDILWVRETWNGDWCDHYIYKADGGSAVSAGYASEPIWHPSIHMPREAARIFLRVTDVRVERLQEITAEQCKKEGMTDIRKSVLDEDEYWYWYKNLWDSTVNPVDLPRCGWDANPWVRVIEFERCERGVTHD